ncbi:major facilitator superfamily transporter [Tritrichomonas foetus]|uniref:Major facilitator superfamily transporter n=1 Tax=Tritrichomonas foetus TaxID=1144522 RepID=A0A1J4KFS8_9EUKA|nr:major facilitator superfamily transporter [Tritrichomonas foetus]|eukprot:OHT08205.1 major facilitator superfamily transporter [Tritrichomonas foetus]
MTLSREIFAVFIILISSTCFGSLTSFPGPAASSMKKLYPGLANYTEEWDIFNNAPRFTAAAGSIIFYPFVVRFGRQLSISIAAFINGLLYLLILPVNENSMTYILVIRFLHGFIWGYMSALTLVYLIETSPSNSYSFTGCMHQFFNVFGICLNNVLAAFCDFRNLAIVCSIISFVFSGLVWLIRDSPVSAQDKARRLAKKTRKAAIKKMKMTKNDEKNVFSRKDHMNEFKSSEELKLDSLDDMTTIISSQSSEGLFSKKYFPIVIKAIILFVFQQFCGTNAILSNLSSIMSKSGLSLDPNIQSFLANAAQLVAVLITAFLVDSFGAKFLWCLSSSLLVILLLAYGFTTYYDTPSFVPVLCIFLYRLCFGLGVGPLTYAIWVQLFSDSTRLGGTMIMMAAHWLVSWVVVYTFPIMNQNIGSLYTVIIYAISTFISIFYGAFCIPDTREKDTEEMALI